MNTNRSGNSEFSASTRLFASTRMHKSRVDGNWVLFAPDRPGLPVVVDPLTRSLLRRFDDGATVDEAMVVSRHLNPTTHDPDLVCALVSFLHKNGFLRDAQESTRYQAVDPRNDSPDGFSVWLHISNRCNLDCAYCFVEKSPAVMSDDVATATARRIATTARRRQVKSFVLNYAGGEPTLVTERVERFHSRLMAELADTDIRVDTGLLSNGTVVTDHLIAFLGREGVKLGISLDGHGTAHDTYRTFNGTGRGSWGVITENIRRLEDNGIRPHILATISENSCHSLAELVRWVFDNGLSVRLQAVRQPSRSWDGSAVSIEDYEPLADQLIEAFDQAFEVLEDPSYSLDFGADLSISELSFDQPTFSCCCGIGSTYVVINECGEVVRCPMTLHDHPVVPADDLLEATRETFPHSSTMETPGRDLRCLDCRWFPVCAGGCPVTNQRVSGNPFAMSPLHRFYEFVIPRYIDFFGRKLLQEAKRKGIEDFHILHHVAGP